jgi:hypothetical protein
MVRGIPRPKAGQFASAYPNLARWLAAHGTIELGPCYETRSFIRVLDEGGLVWKGRLKYRSVDAALADCEAGVGRWLRQQFPE